MAVSSLDDRMLGEKVDNYCSSSEEEECSNFTPGNTSVPDEMMPPLKGSGAYQTGPKGVIEDLRRYKKLESEKFENKKIEYDKLVKKYAMTCEPNSSKMGIETHSDDDLFLQETEEDQQFLEFYNKKRILELQKQYSNNFQGLTFGEVLELDETNYIEAIDNEKPFVTVVIHIYENNTRACEALNGCLSVLAKQYDTVKFCRIKASEAKLSKTFRTVGIPALLIYKNKTVIGNFVSLSETLGDDFFASDVEAFLSSYSILPVL